MFPKIKENIIRKTSNSKIFTIGNAAIIFIINCAIFISIYFSSRIDIWSYEKDLERKIPFTKEELIVCGRYDKRIVCFETNYQNKLIYTFPENVSMEYVAKFTKENVGQTVEIRIDNMQAAFTKVFNMKVQ